MSHLESEAGYEEELGPPRRATRVSLDLSFSDFLPLIPNRRRISTLSTQKLLANGAKPKRHTSTFHSVSREGWRIAWFITLEAFFFVLVTVCLQRGSLLLPRSLTSRSTDVKSVLTVLSIAWQTAALFPILHIPVRIFSSEWSYLHSSTSLLLPGKTDRVSVMTSGILDQLRHAFLTKSSSAAFRAGFATFITALALHNFAPAAISVSTMSVGMPTLLAIGDLTGSVAYNIGCQEQPGTNYSQCPYSAGSSTIDLLASVLEMEQLFSTPYAFTIDPVECSVGYPSVAYVANGSSLSYSTEVVCWRHQCNWADDATSSLLDPSNFNSISWAIQSVPNVTFIITPEIAEPGDILLVSALNYTETLVSGSLWDTVPPIVIDGNVIKAYTFLGINSSMADFTDSPEWSFDLSGLPSTYLAQDEQQNPGTAVLTSVLFCPVALTTSSATSNVSPGGKLHIDWEPPSTPDNPCISALCNSTAQLLISSWEAQGAAESSDILSPLLSKLFLDYPDAADEEYSFLKPYPAETISSNLNTYFASVMKTYASGYINSTYTLTETVQGTVDEQRLALVGSKAVWIVMMVLVLLLLAALFVALACSDENRVPFDLENVSRVLKGH